MHAIIYLLYYGMLGVVAHCGWKLVALQGKANTNKVEFSPWMYFKKDYASIFLSFVAVLIWLAVFKEASGQYPQLNAWTNLSFVAVGFLGSYFIQKIGGRSEKVIDKVIADKTKFADDVQAERDQVEARQKNE